VSVERLIEGKRIVVCAGPGGVGKTSTAAAIGVGMAAAGLKVAVLTIDPAKRLANSLGLEELGNEPQLVDPSRFADAGIEMEGELWALMLDAKRTFDELVDRYSGDERQRDAVLNNRIYQELSNAVAGSTEYMATEKLYELYQEQSYDLLILDTPPTRNALDFLDAPERMSRFIDSRSLKFFMKPGKLGLKVVGRGGGIVFSVLKRITGVDLLRDLSDFFMAFGDMADGIRERAEKVADLLASDETTFVVVTAPRNDSIDEASFFRRRLREGGMPFGGVIVNRVHDQSALDGDASADDLASILGDEALARKVASNFEDYSRLAAHDRDAIDRLERELKGEPMILVPHLENDVHDIAGLTAMNEHLFAPDTVPA
jgi:anion-transporting  ArsA/GET3 family ATPase